MKKVIVTGGTGFIGSWLIQELLRENVEVTAVVRNRSRMLPKIVKDAKLKMVEKEIGNLIPEDFSSDEYDAFFHLGWSGVSSEQKNEIETQLNNIRLAFDALEICSKLNCRVFIAAGTVAEYVFCKDLMDVNARQTPNDIYGAAKVSTYYFLEVRSRQLKQPFIWMIIPSTYGERRNDSNIITYTIRSLLNGERPQYGNLEQMWDFLYVGEVVRAIRLLGEHGIPGKVYGIGSGDYHQLKEYIYCIRDIINPDLEIGIGELPEKSKMTYGSCVNISELRKDTGFVPIVTFKEGIERTIIYQRTLLNV